MSFTSFIFFDKEKAFISGDFSSAPEIKVSPSQAPTSCAADRAG
jgi:hypothetical protein